MLFFDLIKCFNLGREGGKKVAESNLNKEQITFFFTEVLLFNANGGLGDKRWTDKEIQWLARN